MNFSQSVKYTRAKLGLTYRALADQLQGLDVEVNHETLCRWENGTFTPNANARSYILEGLKVLESMHDMENEK